VVQREIAYKEGELYSREKLIDTKQRVYLTGLFSFVTLEARNPQEKPVKPDLILKLVERKPRYMKVGFLTGQEQEQDLTADLSAEFGHRNLFRTGRRISFSAASKFVLLSKFRYLASRFTLNYTQNWTLGLRIPFELEAYYEPGAKSAIQSYRIEQFGGNLNLRQQLRKQTRLWLTGSYQQVNIYGIPEEQVETFRNQQGISIRRKVGFSLENDSRSSIFVPQGGSLTQLQTEYYGGILGGDHNFAKIVLSWSRYFQTPGISQLEVWAFRLKGGKAFEYSLKDFVPSLDRFYLGGASSIRGYDENSLGPKAIDDSTGDTVVVGGKIFMLANVEYRKALFSKLGWSMFLDWGNVWLETKNITIRSMRLSGGFGLQYFSPLGPVRLDYGRRLLRGQDGLKGGRLHLSILYAF
jgi:outer membrane protein insertion porin family